MTMIFHDIVSVDGLAVRHTDSRYVVMYVRTMKRRTWYYVEDLDNKQNILLRIH
jgi:GTP-dependent phosphoenolpyruvate carboxykinase